MTSMRMSQKSLSTSADKTMRFKNLDFTAQSEPYCVLCRIPLHSTPKLGITHKPVSFICPTSRDFFFSLIADI